MTDLAFQSAPHTILAFAQTDRWSSAITTHSKSKPLSVRVVDSLDKLASSLPNFPDAIVVVEIGDPASVRIESLKQLLRIANEIDVPVFAVGFPGMGSDRIQLQRIGFAEVLESTGEAGRLIRLAENFWQNRPSSQLSIEELVNRDMPWDTNSGETDNSTCQST